MANNMSNSATITAWAVDLELTERWRTGETIGWERVDGERAIETNGDPVWSSDDGFAEAWEARGLISERINAEAAGREDCENDVNEGADPNDLTAAPGRLGADEALLNAALEELTMNGAQRAAAARRAKQREADDYAKQMSEFVTAGPGEILARNEALCCLCGEPCLAAAPPQTSAVCWRCQRDDDQLGEER